MPAAARSCQASEQCGALHCSEAHLLQDLCVSNSARMLASLRACTVRSVALDVSCTCSFTCMHIPAWRPSPHRTPGLRDSMGRPDKHVLCTPP